ncbi:piggyBac transposable element-derived protein 4-like [Galendromus occidentalis]|uniref:PiggyBac transposable element-derived protein 4-like n=1 Tax=Galendromus occidentalis TaxID=34638 RepID=A0AAJ7SIE9_9ACAR|nr:piggyBac transposable element-derived protein 4-like [Galendromus occidentalis]
MRKFLGLLMYMGLVKYPNITDYWRKDCLYRNELVASAMSRNRFQLLLRFIHFSDNEEADIADRSNKFIKILTLLQDKFCEAINPGEKLTIDETMIPFRGRLSFLQYMPGKSHKYGVKVFKLCNPDGYTFRMRVYTGKSDGISKSLPSGIVQELAEPYLDAGRTLTADNYFTSVPLAKNLLRRKTHFLGTLRSNRKHLPKSVVNSRLARDQVVGKMSNEGIVVGKWRDKRDVYFLTTKHDLRMVTLGRSRRDGVERAKPAAILEYNKTKQGVDKSDQMASYQSPLRKSIRWYHKVVFEILLNTAAVNSRIIFNELTGNNITMKNFREMIVQDFLGFQDRAPTPLMPRRDERHELIRSEGSDRRNRKKRGRCQNCYAKIAASQGRKAAQGLKRVNTMCGECEKWLCVPCFVKSH